MLYFSSGKEDGLIKMCDYELYIMVTWLDTGSSEDYPCFSSSLTWRTAHEASDPVWNMQLRSVLDCNKMRSSYFRILFSFQWCVFESSGNPNSSWFKKVTPTLQSPWRYPRWFLGLLEVPFVFVEERIELHPSRELNIWLLYVSHLVEANHRVCSKIRFLQIWK